MLELAHILGEYRNDMVIVGGWVPELLLPKAKPKHTGSLDVDLALDHTKLDEDRYATILETISAKGYRKGEKGFQYVRTVSVDGRDLDVLVEFLAAEYEWPKRKKGKEQAHGWLSNFESALVAIWPLTTQKRSGLMADCRMESAILSRFRWLASFHFW